MGSCGAGKRVLCLWCVRSESSGLGSGAREPAKLAAREWPFLAVGAGVRQQWQEGEGKEERRKERGGREKGKKEIRKGKRKKKKKL